MSVSLQRDSLVDAFAAEIERRIRSGELQPGDRLPSLAELGKLFGVGFSTVRESIRSLSLLGVLVTQPGRGTQVSPDVYRVLETLGLLRIRLEDLDALTMYEARSALEVDLTALAAEKAGPDDIQRLQEAVDAALACRANTEAYLRAHGAFHHVVAEAAHNRLLEQLYSITREMFLHVARDVSREALLLESKTAMQAPDFAPPGEREVLEAIRSHDAAAARRYAEEHVRIWGETLRAALRVGRE